MIDFPQINVTHQTTMQKLREHRENVVKLKPRYIIFKLQKITDIFKCHLVIAPKGFSECQ